MKLFKQPIIYYINEPHCSVGPQLMFVYFKRIFNFNDLFIIQRNLQILRCICIVIFKMNYSEIIRKRKLSKFLRTFKIVKNITKSRN